MVTGSIPSDASSPVAPVVPSARRTLLLLGGAILAVGVIAVLAVALSTRAPASYPAGSPEAAFQSYYSAWLANDLDTAYGSFSSRVQADATLDDYRTNAVMYQWQGGEDRRVVLTGSTISGDHASLDLRVDQFSSGGGLFGLGGGDVWSHDVTVPLVREDGSWRIDQLMAGVEYTIIEKY